MKRHFVFLTFIFSVVSAFSAYISGDYMAFLGWMTAAVASIDHFLTLRHFE
jgi:hypothetical protein